VRHGANARGQNAFLPEHAAALARLGTEQIGWLTTVSKAGAPQSSPIWFLLWDAESALVFSQPDTPKYRNGLGRLGLSDEQFRAISSVPLRFTPARARVW